jgi:hypothetical protein
MPAVAAGMADSRVFLDILAALYYLIRQFKGCE